MEESPVAFPHAGSRASVEVSTEAAAFTEAVVVTEVVVTEVAVTGDSFRLPQAQLLIWRDNSCARTI
jgi:hypothetical protein